MNIDDVFGTRDFPRSGAFAAFPAGIGMTAGDKSVLAAAQPYAHAVISTPNLQSAQERSP